MNEVVVLTPERILEVTEDVLRRYGFDARSRHIALFGVCRDCQRAAMANEADTH